jgi:hypothetical protein
MRQAKSTIGSKKVYRNRCSRCNHKIPRGYYLGEPICQDCVDRQRRNQKPESKPSLFQAIASMFWD